MPGRDLPDLAQAAIAAHRPPEKRLLLAAHGLGTEHPLGQRGDGLPDDTPDRVLPAADRARIAGRPGGLATQHALVQRDQVAAKGARKSGSRVCVVPHAAHFRRAMGTRWAARSARSLVSQAARSRT